MHIYAHTHTDTHTHTYTHAHAHTHTCLPSFNVVHFRAAMSAFRLAMSNVFAERAVDENSEVGLSGLSEQNADTCSSTWVGSGVVMEIPLVAGDTSLWKSMQEKQFFSSHNLCQMEITELAQKEVFTVTLSFSHERSSDGKQMKTMMQFLGANAKDRRSPVKRTQLVSLKTPHSPLKPTNVRISGFNSQIILCS